MKNILRKDSPIINVGVGAPNNALGSNGDFVITRVNQDIRLYCKYSNQWFQVGANLFSSLPKSKHQSVIKDPVFIGNIELTRNKLMRKKGDLAHFKFNSVGSNTRAKTLLFDSGTLDSGGAKDVSFKFNSALSHSTASLGGSDVYDLIKGTITAVSINGWNDVRLLSLTESGTGKKLEFYVKSSDAVTSSILKIGFDSDDYATIGVADNGVTTIATVDGDATIGHLTLDVDGDLILDPASGITQFRYNGDTNDYADIRVGANGVTTLATFDDGGTVGHLTLQPDGDLVLDPVSQKIIINATDDLYFDGGTHTFISEHGDDILRITVGGDTIIQFSEKGDDGNEVHFGSSCAGFTQLEPTYDATDTEVDFRHSNKQFLTFGSGNITNLKLTFPLVSGNFVLLIKQDGTGSRTITNYKVFEFDETAADGEAAVKFAGGSNPTLTTDANHVDILSFYWDADNEIAYGVATLDFQF
jgi:hypothetical protein